MKKRILIIALILCMALILGVYGLVYNEINNGKSFMHNDKNNEKSFGSIPCEINYSSTENASFQGDAPSSLQGALHYYIPEKKDNITIIGEIATNVSESHDYQRGIYDCTQFAEEATRQLKEKGFNATCVFGIYYDTYDEWVELSSNNSGNGTTYNYGVNYYRDPYAHNWVDIYEDNRTIHLEVTNGMNVGIIDDSTYKQNYLPRVVGKCI